MHMKWRGLLSLSLSLLILGGCGANKQEGTVTGQTNASSYIQPVEQSTAAPQATTNSPNPSPASQGEGGDALPAGPITALRLADFDKGWIGGNGWIAGTDNSGASWGYQYKGTGEVTQIFALNDRQAWATVKMESTSKTVGGPLKLLHTTNGGISWEESGSVPNEGFLHFVSEKVGLSGSALTSDGGKTWKERNVPEGVTGEPYFNNSDYGWAVTTSDGNVMVKRTKDGGKSWDTVMSRKLESELNGAVIRSGGKPDVWVELIGDSGMTQTSYSLFHSSDGGSQWTTVIANSSAGGGPAPGFPIGDASGPRNEGTGPGALYVVDAKTAVMGGVCSACDEPNTFGWTRDGGATWHNSADKLAGYGAQLLGFANADHGWWLLNDMETPSVLYTTEDGGETWKRRFEFAMSADSRR